MKYKKGFIILVIILVLVVIIAIGAIAYNISKGDSIIPIKSTKDDYLNKKDISSMEEKNFSEDIETEIKTENTSMPNLRKKGETCGGDLGGCEKGLKCGYPCGIQGCKYVCQPENELPKP